MNRLAITVVAAVLVIAGIVFFLSYRSQDSMSGATHKAEEYSEKAHIADDEATATDSTDNRMESRRVERRIRERTPPKDVPEDLVTTKNGEPVEDPNRPWKDPVNKRVLGDKRWMAEVTPEMHERIENHLDQKLDNAEARRVQNLDRNTATGQVYHVVEGCYNALREEHPDATGRVSVVFDVTTANGTGRILDAEIGKIWKFNEYPEFSECVVSGSQNLSFEALTDGMSVTVEYPFWFEGEE